ncbi:MAG: hypothetical protein Q7S19_01060 [bacterium]|nr:hypothetical protein [bacterium]
MKTCKRSVLILFLVIMPTMFSCIGCAGRGDLDKTGLYTTPTASPSPGGWAPIYKPELTPPLSPFPTPYPEPAFLQPCPLTVFNPLNITPDSAVLLGNVDAYTEMSMFPVELGFEWVDSREYRPDGKTAWTREMYDPSYQLGMITSSLQGRLTPATKYTYRTFLAIYDPGKEKPKEWFSEPIEFKTLSVSEQIIITPLPPPAPMTFNPLGIMDPADLTSNSATLIGNVALYPERFTATKTVLGFEWGLTSDDPEKWKTENFTPSSRTGLIPQRITGLLPGTKYSYRIFLDINDKPRYRRGPVTFTTR